MRMDIRVSEPSTACFPLSGRPQKMHAARTRQRMESTRVCEMAEQMILHDRANEAVQLHAACCRRVLNMSALTFDAGSMGASRYKETAKNTGESMSTGNFERITS